jgi:F-type H+-transporting ATPase subunit b
MTVLATIGLLAAKDETRTHSWIWPEGAEMLWGTIAFLIVVFLLWKFGWPQVKKSMRERTSKIGEQLTEAAQAKVDAEQAAVAIRQAKGDIGAERTRMLQDADEQAARLLADGRARLDQEAAELEAKADQDLTAAEGRISTEVQGEVAELAAQAAEHVVAEALQDPGLQNELVEDFIARVGASGGTEVRN